MAAIKTLQLRCLLLAISFSATTPCLAQDQKIDLAKRSKASFDGSLESYSRTMLEVEQRRLESLVRFLDREGVRQDIKGTPVPLIEQKKKECLHRLSQVLSLRQRPSKQLSESEQVRQLRKKLELKDVELMVLRSKLEGSLKQTGDKELKDSIDAYLPKWLRDWKKQGEARLPLDKKQLDEVLQVLERRRKELLYTTDAIRKQIEAQLSDDTGERK